MFRAWNVEKPFILDRPQQQSHHDPLLDCKCFKGEFSLSSSAVQAFMNNLDRYTDEELDCVKYFPAHVKSLIARKFLSSHAFIQHKSVNLKKIISVMLHDKMDEVNFTFYAVDDEVIKSLEVCKNLEVLRIDGRPNDHLIRGCGDSVMANLSSQAIIEALANFPRMLDLRIINCDAVTDEVVIAIAASCPKLQKLNLSNCKYITDEGLKALLHLRELIALDISGSQVTDEGMNALINSDFIDILEDIRIDHCREIKDFDLSLFATKCKALMVFSCRGHMSADKMNNFNSEHLKNLKQLNWAIEW